MCRTILSRCCSGAPRRRIWSYETGELAALARECLGVLAAANPACRKSASSRRIDRWRPLNSISVIEIVNDDMPFLVNSVMAELTERGLATRLVVHPILAVSATRPAAHRAAERGGQGARTRRAKASSTSMSRASTTPAAAPRRPGAGAGPDRGPARVKDWRPMIRRVNEVIQDLKANPPPVPVDDIAEAIQFLEWVAADNFTLLGVGDYTLDGRKKAPISSRCRRPGSACCAAATSRC